MALVKTMISKMKDRNLALLSFVIASQVFGTGLIILIKPFPVKYLHFLNSFDYLIIAVLIFLERKNLADFHIDKLVIVFYLVFGSILKISSRDYTISFYYSQIFNIFVAVALFIAIHKDMKHLEGIKLKRLSLNLATGLIIGFLIYLFINIKSFAFLNELLSKALEENIFLILTFQFVLSVIYHLGTAALVEEFIFRGFLWGYLRRIGWRDSWILVFQAFMFWIAHAASITSQDLQFLILFVPGLVLGVLAWKTRSISTGLIAHAVYNSVVFLVKLILSKYF